MDDLLFFILSTLIGGNLPKRNFHVLSWRQEDRHLCYQRPLCASASVKHWSHWSCDESKKKKGILSGDLTTRKFIWPHDFLFTFVCIWHTPIRTWERKYGSLIVVVIYCHLSKLSVGQAPRLCNLPSRFDSVSTVSADGERKNGYNFSFLCSFYLPPKTYF
jgi:hypothetical protein